MTRNNPYRELHDAGVGRAKVCEMLVIYFAANPDETLTCKDAMVKFDVGCHGIYSATKALRSRELVSITKSQPKLAGKTQEVYSAGPRLLQLIGRAVQ